MNRVAVAQMTSSASVAQNLDQLIQIFKQAAEQEVKLLLLPENFAFMGLHENDKLTIAEVEGDGRIQSCVSHLASYYGVWVIAGTIPLKANDGRVFASCLVFDALGKTVARYDKIHLFDVTIPGGEFHQTVGFTTRRNISRAFGIYCNDRRCPLGAFVARTSD